MASKSSPPKTATSSYTAHSEHDLATNRDTSKTKTTPASPTSPAPQQQQKSALQIHIESLPKSVPQVIRDLTPSTPSPRPSHPPATARPRGPKPLPTPIVQARLAAYIISRKILPLDSKAKPDLGGELCAAFGPEVKSCAHSNFLSRNSLKPRLLSVHPIKL